MYITLTEKRENELVEEEIRIAMIDHPSRQSLKIKKYFKPDISFFY